MEFDMKLIKKEGLTFIEYLTLVAVYQKKTNSKDVFEGNLGSIYTKDVLSLQAKGYIKVIGKEIELRNKSRKFFEGDRDPFLVWFNTFPIKTPSGRYLRPSSDDTIKGKSIRKKWSKHFLNKPLEQKKALAVLEAEMNWRKEKNSLEYMHNAETWLNQGDWQVYDYLISQRGKIDVSNLNDF